MDFIKLFNELREIDSTKTDIFPALHLCINSLDLEIDIDEISLLIEYLDKEYIKHEALISKDNMGISHKILLEQAYLETYIKEDPYARIENLYTTEELKGKFPRIFNERTWRVPELIEIEELSKYYIYAYIHLFYQKPHQRNSCLYISDLINWIQKNREKEYFDSLKKKLEESKGDNQLLKELRIKWMNHKIEGRHEVVTSEGTTIKLITYENLVLLTPDVISMIEELFKLYPHSISAQVSEEPPTIKLSDQKSLRVALLHKLGLITEIRNNLAVTNDNKVTSVLISLGLFEEEDRRTVKGYIKDIRDGNLYNDTLEKKLKKELTLLDFNETY